MQSWQVVGNRAQVAAPLLMGDRAVGILALIQLEPRPFSEQQIALLETFANQAAIAIENARLFERQDRVRGLQALGEVSRAVASSLDLPTVLTTIVDNAARLSDSEGGVLYEYDEGSGAFVLRATQDTTAELDVLL